MDNIALIAGACMVAFIVWIFAPQKRERSAQPKHAKSKIPDFGYILPDGKIKYGKKIISIGEAKRKNLILIFPEEKKSGYTPKAWR